jgi:hypothetical protein
MFTYDSFGRPTFQNRAARRLAMRRNPSPGDPQSPPPGQPQPTPTPGQPATPGAPEPQPTDLGFPANTPWRDMTAEQQSAYWRHQSQGWEQRAKGRDDYDAIKADRDRLAAANLTDEQRAAQEAIEEARRDGENTGAERYLSAAVRAHFQRLTGLDDEKTTTAFRHVRPESFTDQQGEIDTTALQEFASTFGTNGGAGSGAPTDPILQQQQRQQQPGAGGTPSIAEATRQREEELRAGK